MTTPNSSLTDKEYYQLTISIGKALNSYEMPVKSKHIRAAIIGTYHSNGGHAFWAIALRQPLQENRITAWKFCHVLHKISRDGHPLVLQHSLRHRGQLTELGKLWGHLNDGYGLCIKQYTKLLVTKLNFHDRNTRFPGNLVLRRGELEQIAANDINMYFQLAVEMFDYLDDIIALQATIFNSITTFAVSSMTNAGQCRLAPLIPCIQDSNQLYDFSVRLMFLLHANLPEDLLVGHRERFRTLFRQLNSFYKQSSQLQYFQSLITVPKLPNNPPNFLMQSDLRNYQAPVVVIPQEVDNLVDTSAPPTPTPSESDSIQQRREPTPPPPAQPSIDYEKLLRERDDYIRQLRQENEMYVERGRAVVTEKAEIENQLKQKLMRMNSEMTQVQDELSNLRIQKEELELKFQTAPDLEQKVQAEEERAKSTEEKFQKLKNMYTQIRDEHIKLLRQHGETTKKLETASKQASDAEIEKDQMVIKLKELEVQHTKISENFQQSSSESENIKTEYESKLSQLQKEKENLIDQYQNDDSTKSAEIAELKINIEIMQKNFEELKENFSKLQSEKEAIESEHKELSMKKEEIENSFKVNFEGLHAEKVELEKQKSSRDTELEEVKQKLHERDEEVASLEVKLNEAINSSNEKIETLNGELMQKGINYLFMHANYDRVMGTKEDLETDVQDLLFQQEEIMQRNRALLETCIKASEETSARTIQENETPGFQINAAYFIMVAEELQDALAKLKNVHGEFLNDNNSHTESMVRTTVKCSHLLNLIHERGMAICNKSTNINSGEKIADEIKEFGQSTLHLYQTLIQNDLSSEVGPTVDKLKDMLYRITNVIGDISGNNDEIDKLGDLVEKELNGMDKAIEEAAKKIADLLEQSRASDSGIKLEVNEKILDSCTTLMQSIQILVQKSRKVQAEIVALGKGTASAKEFYKRNHQWTEGMISAAKSVATSATLLVDAANKAVSGEANLALQVVVAAQEIAACVAALVVSSKVKAPRDSPNIKELTIASKSVTQSTGTVVATAKSCSQRLDDSQHDLDFTKLSVHQAKTKEMEVQVRVLELEQALQVERMRLAALRRQNYQEE